MIARGCLVAVVAGLLAVPAVRADDTQWDWLAGTEWYVPAANLLAYYASDTDLESTLPVRDQTLWNITTSSNGQFSGNTQATLTIGETSSVSTTTVTGVVTPGGQVRMIFTPSGDSAGGPVTVGIGQMRDIAPGGVGTLAEMQMITGASGVYVTHWAYMAQIPDGSFTPPTAADYPPDTLLSTEWAWMDGTSWALSAPAVFGTTDAAQFSVAAYTNGYFWGSGVAPASVGGAAFTLIGSATPEGDVLFNVLVNGVFTNLAGQITGDATTGAMALRDYMGTDDFGDAATANVSPVPEPSPVALLLAAGLLLLRMRRRGTAGA